MIAAYRPQPMAGQAIAYYGRVSTPRQKLEHQWESVELWAGREDISIPPELRFQDKEKRHKSEKREAFNRVLELARAGKLDWIVIASFERWGFKGPDELFEFRKLLKDAGARLWSVGDQLDLTGCADDQYHRIISLAVAHTMAMGTYGDQNIRKMISMALAGWHASKEHPYGTDLMCCLLTNKEPLFRVHLVSKSLERSGPRLYKIIHADGRVELANRMPPRDCKSNGYRLVPSMDETRIENVLLIMELIDQGLTHREIGNRLHAMGRTYFGKHFAQHAIEAIITNSAYIGMPAWGKSACGFYRQVFDKVSTRTPEKKKGEPKNIIKDEQHFVYPIEPVFAPMVPVDLFERVKARIKAKPKAGPRQRRRSKTIHPLNGLLVCPDCGKRMVINNSGAKGKRVDYFMCGSYAKSGKIACRPNSVRFGKVNEAMRLAWDKVSQQLKDLGNFKVSSDGKILRVAMGKHVEYVKLLLDLWDYIGLEEIPCPINPFTASDEEYKKHEKEVEQTFLTLFALYQKKWAGKQKKSQKRLAEIDKEINKFGDLMETTPSKTLQDRWGAKLVELENEKTKLAESNCNLLERIVSVSQHALTLLDTLTQAKQAREANLWETFILRVEPIMEEFPFGKGTQRVATGFRFVPKPSANELFSTLELSLNRKDRDLFQQISRLFSQVITVGRQQYRMPQSSR